MVEETKKQSNSAIIEVSYISIIEGLGSSCAELILLLNLPHKPSFHCLHSFNKMSLNLFCQFEQVIPNYTWILREFLAMPCLVRVFQVWHFIFVWTSRLYYYLLFIIPTSLSVGFCLALGLTNPVMSARSYILLSE